MILFRVVGLVGSDELGTVIIELILAQVQMNLTTKAELGNRKVFRLVLFQDDARKNSEDVEEII